MVTLPLTATDDAILTTLDAWLNHLARNEYEQAFEFTYHRKDDHSTPERLREQIAFYGDQFNAAVRLPPAAADERPEHFVQRPNAKARPAKRLSGGRLLGSYESLVTANSEADSESLGEVALQLPFGGKWSDVFATFEMVNHGARLVFVLKSIYVH